MAGRYCYGRRPAVHTLRTMRSAIALAAALDPLGPAPAECRDYLSAMKGAGPQMYDNNILGTCVCADTANTLILRTANAAAATVVPTVDNVISLYSAVGGYVPGNPATDNGCVEVDMLQYLAKTGFLGHKADAFGSIDPANQDHIKWSTLLFGSCRLGLNLPGYAEDQFERGQPWDVSTVGNQSIGGHDVPVVDFRGGLFYVFTWGRVQLMTPAALVAWSEEAHSTLFFDWVREQGQSPSGLDLNTLAQKMQSVDLAA